jgi:hypothetical protein
MMNKGKGLLLALLFFLSSCVSTSAIGDKKDEALVWRLAQEFSGIHVDNRAPSVEYVKHEWLEEKVCPGKTCLVLGLYVYGEDGVYVDDSLNMEHVYGKSILLHEYVHVLQKLRKPNINVEDIGCEEFVDREMEAYTAQSLFLARSGDTRRMRPVRPRCQ